MHKKKTDQYLQISMAIVLLLNIVFWFSIRDMRARWESVPPPPDQRFASAYGLGDTSFAYRLNGLMLQNMGDVGGRTTSLKDYDYDRLTKWFFLQDKLDPESNYVPYLAMFYFGAVQIPAKFTPVLEYLKVVGSRPYGEKWRWLVYAVEMAKNKIDDKDKALELAHILTQTKDPDAPTWIQQMPAFVLTAKGDKEAAYALMVEILKTSATKLHPNEVNAMKGYICEQILDKEQAAKNALCEDLR